MSKQTPTLNKTNANPRLINIFSSFRLVFLFTSMLIFSAALYVYGLLKSIYEGGSKYMIDQMLITEETVSSMNAEPYIFLFDGITKYNINDPIIKDYILANFVVIGSYYKKINEASSFEPFKALPSLIHALGKNSDDTESIWLGIGIFLKTLAGIHTKRIQRITLQERNQAILRFEMNCAKYGMKGIKDGSFFKIFQTRMPQEQVFAIFFKFAGDHKAESLAAYLTLCELDKNRLITALDLMKVNQFTEGPLVFSQVIVQIYLNGRISLDDPTISNELRTLHKFMKENKFLSQTDLFVFNKILLK